MRSFWNWFHRNPSRSRSTPRSVKPRLESLESRDVPSAATLSVAQNFARTSEAVQTAVTQEYVRFLGQAPDADTLATLTNAIQQGATLEQLDAALATSNAYVSQFNGAADWARGLTEDLLGRPSANVQPLLGQLAGGDSPFDVALSVASSLDRYAVSLDDAYQSMLGRPLDAATAPLWADALSNGLTLSGIRPIIAGTEEYFARNGGLNAGFIDGITRDILGRVQTALASVGQSLSTLASPITNTVTNPSTTTPRQTASTPSTITLPEGASRLITLKLDPLDINLLGLRITSDPIEVNVSALPGDGKLLGNLLTTVSNLINLQGVNDALNNVLSSVVTLLNSTELDVAGVLPSAVAPLPTTTNLLNLYVAPVHLDLLGALVDTSPIRLSITAESGEGKVLGNVLASLANLFNPPLPDQLDLNFVNDRLSQLLADLDALIPGIAPAPTTPRTVPAGADQILSLTVPPIDLNLLGLTLQTSQIQVNADAYTGDGLLLGNVLTTLLNTLGATPESLDALNGNLNSLLAKVIGVLNAATLTLPPDAVGTLSQVLQTLALPDLINQTGAPASVPILNLAIASTDGTTPPVDVNLLGLNITTSNVEAKLLAQTGNGQVLGNLLYNVANLLNPGGAIGLIPILNALSL